MMKIALLFSGPGKVNSPGINRCQKMNSEETRLVEVARIEQAHGLKGTLRVRVEKRAESLFQSGSILYLTNRRGDKIPSRILDVRVEEKQKERLFFVKFDRIADRDQAAGFLDSTVYADESLLEPEEESGADIIGFEIRVENRTAGQVIDLISNPAHPILEARIDGIIHTVLIPWVDEYVTEVDEDRGWVHCRNLETLTEL